uniref:tubulin-specific chaperone C isoform X1 n=1 Tax=Pristiophorus japonicus TaxID=55135 RepID=UPI00398EC309
MALVGENRENLTEEMPEYDRRKEKMVEILQRRDQERQQGVERRKLAKDVISVKEEKANFFTTAFSEEKAEIEALLEGCEVTDRSALSAHFEEISLKMQRLQKFVNDSMMFLSAYELRQAQDAVQKLQATVVEKREACLPKKKFAFKSRKKEGAGPKELKSVDSPSDKKASDPIVIEENLCGFSDADSQGHAGDTSGAFYQQEQTLTMRFNTSAAFGLLRKRVFEDQALKSSKLTVYRAVVIPALLYGSETETMYSRHLKSLEKYHQRCLCKILQIPWEFRCTNVRVLDQANSPSIETLTTLDQLRWAGHIVRMPGMRLPKQALYSELLHGKRAKGGKRKCYKDTLKASLIKCYIPIDIWETLAKDRPK